MTGAHHVRGPNVGTGTQGSRATLLKGGAKVVVAQMDPVDLAEGRPGGRPAIIWVTVRVSQRRLNGSGKRAILWGK